MKTRYRANTDTNLEHVFSAMRTVYERLGKDVLITIEKHVPPKTRNQNDYLHVCFRQIAKEVGHTESEIKEYMKDEYGPMVVVGKNHILKTPSRMVSKSVSEYSKEEISELIEHCHVVAANLGIVIDPYE